MSVVTRFKVKGPVSLVILALNLLVVLSISSPALAASVNPSSTQANWPMFGYNLQHTHYNPGETALSPSTVSKLVLAWSYTTGEPILGPSTVVNGVVYIGSEDGKGTMYALKWSTAIGAAIEFSSPAVANGVVYIGAFDDSIHALKASTGKSLWSYKTGNEIQSSPTVVNGMVFIGSINHAIYAFALPA